MKIQRPNPTPKGCHDCSQMFSQTITEPRRGVMIVAKRLAKR